MLGRFSGFAKSVILRLSEARDLGDVDRCQFYEDLKVYTAAPPDVLRVDEKNLREYNIANCCSVIFKANYKTDGIYLPPDDRRHFVAWANLTKEDFNDGYWRDLYHWYNHGGAEHVAAYLASVDTSTPRCRHRRPWHFGKSSTHPARLRTRNSAMQSTESASRISLLCVKPRAWRLKSSLTGYSIARTPVAYRIVSKLAATSPSATTVPKMANGKSTAGGKQSTRKPVSPCGIVPTPS
jgi:hypothetical protein